MRVVISQSMYFPWVGLLEQIKLCDVFVHYDDVQFTKGFYNRVQIKTSAGPRWMTVPLEKHDRFDKIDGIKVSSIDWKSQHRNSFLNAYRNAPYVDDAISIMDLVFKSGGETIADVSRTSIIALCSYFNIGNSCHFFDATGVASTERSSERLLSICQILSGKNYITGHGARNYLDHELFEHNDISVLYMDYQKTPYPQRHGAFTPFVTALDLVANCGTDGSSFMSSQAVHWREFLGE